MKNKSMYFDKSKISIIIPLYNCQDYIECCVMSCLNQNYDDIEVIVINDGSTDKSLAKLDNIKDKRLIILSQDNKGVNFARNKGIDNSSGDYILFLDADDYLIPNSISLLMHKANETNIDLLIGRFSGDINQKRLVDLSFVLKSGIYDKNHILKLFLSHNFPPSLCGKVFKRQLFENVEFYNLRIAEDILVLLQVLLKINKCIVVDDRIYFYRYNRNSAMQSDFSNEKITDWMKSYFILRELMNKSNHSEIDYVVYYGSMELYTYLRSGNSFLIDRRLRKLIIETFSPISDKLDIRTKVILQMYVASFISAFFLIYNVKLIKKLYNIFKS